MTEKEKSHTFVVKTALMRKVRDIFGYFSDIIDLILTIDDDGREKKRKSENWYSRLQL